MLEENVWACKPLSKPVSPPSFLVVLADGGPAAVLAVLAVLIIFVLVLGVSVVFVAAVIVACVCKPSCSITLSRQFVSSLQLHHQYLWETVALHRKFATIISAQSIVVWVTGAVSQAVARRDQSEWKCGVFLRPPRKSDSHSC